MIGLAMKSWPDKALRNVLDQPIEGWGIGSRPAGCLIGTAENYGPAATMVHLPGVHKEGRNYLSKAGVRVGDRFDNLCSRFTLPRVVRTIKARALRELLSRHPLESRLIETRKEPVHS